jgi:hypothetical protein
VSARSFFARHFSFFVFSFATFALATLSACGRSNLDDYLLTDAGPPVDTGADVGDSQPHPDAGHCNATTCPTGCCDATGTCQTGASNTQCGSSGEACQSCTAEGFQLCDPVRHACGNPVASCTSTNCSTGCCDGNVCFAGSDPNECGGLGGSCGHCASFGEVCIDQRCYPTGCGPQNCSGCCFGDQCLSGTDPTACGIGGQVCGNCAAQGTNCVAQGSGGVCEGQPTCGPQNCTGCCEGNVCVPGTDPNQCGIGGQVCTDCTSQGGMCISSPQGQGGFCETQTGCSPGNCPGCCENDACVAGTSDTACGLGGQTCLDCAVSNATCGGGLCNQGPPVCNAQTCPFGCCDGTNCLPGNLDTFCGSGGNACIDCGASNESCSAGQTCVGVAPTCNATNCTGCCDQTNTCQAGFIDTQCGQNGASCEDCTQIVPSSTCDVSVSPRTCESQQVQCPAPYPSCPPTVETPSPTQQDVCSPSDLQNAGSACEGGAHSAACDSFFSFEQSQNAACATCLSAFDYDFSELTGLTTCVAPFADASCNHITGCLVDCTDKSCAGCSGAGALQTCRNDVPNTVCSTYYQGAQCIESAFLGPGSFCNPGQGSGLFGDWLTQVGQYYCGQ